MPEDLPKLWPAPLPFCVSKATGQAWPAATPEEIANLVRGAEVSAVARKRRGPAAFAVAADIDPGRLEQAGWGVVFGKSVPAAIGDALKPLLDRRARQAGDRFFRFDDAKRCRPDQTARLWVAENGGDFNAPDPRDGVPYFLLLVADPAEIAFEFQYDLDLNYAVGRLWFDRVDDFAAYADSVVAQETAGAALRPKQIGIVATRHDSDAATQMFHDLVATPLRDGVGGHLPIGADSFVERTSLMGPEATKQAVLSLLKEGKGAPAILFTGSHGLGLKRDDPALTAEQGAIVCGDWPGNGHGAITGDQILAGADLPADAQVAGMIHFMFACYGGGCPQFDNFDRMSASPAQIADKPFIAALPQALLAHPNGSALAVIAHVERAWAYSFFNEFGQPRINLFRNVLTELAAGKRVGVAVDRANGYWADHSTRLSELQFQAKTDPDIDDETLGAVWIARDDARNLIVLGDPAVQVRF